MERLVDETPQRVPDSMLAGGCHANEVEVLLGCRRAKRPDYLGQRLLVGLVVARQHERHQDRDVTPHLVPSGIGVLNQQEAHVAFKSILVGQ